MLKKTGKISVLDIPAFHKMSNVRNHIPGSGREKNRHVFSALFDQQKEHNKSSGHIICLFGLFVLATGIISKLSLSNYTFSLMVCNFLFLENVISTYLKIMPNKSEICYYFHTI